MDNNIKKLIEANPGGLLKLHPEMTITEYRENYGFNLKNTWTIYQSESISNTFEERFAFSGKSLENLFEVRSESEGDLLIVYIVETIKNGKVNCHLILSDAAYRQLLDDKTCHILQVHQMYKTFFEDHIALNLAN